MPVINTVLSDTPKHNIDPNAHENMGWVTEDGNVATSTAFKMQDIPEGSDLNDFLTPGFYTIPYASITTTILNLPDGENKSQHSFSLHVYNWYMINGFVCQDITIGSGTELKRKYFRTRSSIGVWSEWQKIIDESILTSALTGYLPIDGNASTASKLKISNIPNNSDLNNYKTAGVYAIISSSYTIANKPGTRAGVLHVSNTESASPLAFQVFFEYSTNTTPCKIYYRGYYNTNDVWSEWATVANKEDLVVMTGATASAAGKTGLVPAPSAGSATRYLRSDGTWQVPPNTTYTLSSFGITATAAELNKLDGVTATAAEINKLDGLMPTTAELNYVDGVTSNIQTQLNNKAGKPTRVTVSLPATGWTQDSATGLYKKTVTVSGVSATETAQMIHVTPANASRTAYMESGVYASEQAANSLTFNAVEVPTSSLTVYVVIETL